ncbi:MAG TPA: beta-ketoacyl-ACP synthase II [Nocardioidaceae bacterium]|nr:beta-ketoacyl-ACP synthase II [Nocardioidaceae bacterium]
MLDRVVVTGWGALTPVGNDAPGTWEALLAGKSGIGPITRFDATGLPVRIAGEVKDFDPAGWLPTKRLRRSARLTHLALAAAREAVADAGLVIDTSNASRIGVAVNTAVAGMGEIADASAAVLGAGPGAHRTLSPYFVSSVIPNMAACEVAIDLGLHGPVVASALACASGNYALLEGLRMIRCGEADVVVCGGTDASISRVMFEGLCSMGALSQRNDEPQLASRPFDADRDGFVYGEGAVVAVLETEAHASERGVTPYAEVAGGALTADGFHVSAPEPNSTYAAEAIRLALERSGVAPDEVDYICAHGTSTRANDRTETAAVRAALGPAADRVALSSPKSMVGHLIGAAGALSAMVASLAIRDQVVPPTINLVTPDPECDLDYVPGRARKMEISTTLVNAFGFGGQNCVLVLRSCA